jgi:hypothetical protein
MTDAADLITRYWTVCEARDWAAFAELLAPDVVYEIPQTRERIRGRENYLAFNTTYPGDWHLDIVRVVGADQHGVSWTNFRVDGGEQAGLCFFDINDSGLIQHITDFWPEPYSPPPGREHLTELY